jgi:hypothetical protein
VTGDIHSSLGHYLYCQRIQTMRGRSGGKGGVSIPPCVPRPTLRHLTSTGIPGA